MNSSLQISQLKIKDQKKKMLQAKQELTEFKQEILMDVRKAKDVMTGAKAKV